MRQALNNWLCSENIVQNLTCVGFKSITSHLEAIKIQVPDWQGYMLLILCTELKRCTWIFVAMDLVFLFEYQHIELKLDKAYGIIAYLVF